MITLAVADALNCLTLPESRVVIPDMIYFEVTQDIVRAGAEDIVGWARNHRNLVEIAPTTVFAEFQALRSIDARTRSRGRGELSALEVLRDETDADDSLEAILLYEDADIRSRRFKGAMPERVAAVSTGDFLRALEKAGLIQSADHVLDAAAAKGRNIDSQRRADPESEGNLLVAEHLARRSVGRTPPR